VLGNTAKARVGPRALSSGLVADAELRPTHLAHVAHFLADRDRVRRSARWFVSFSRRWGTPSEGDGDQEQREAREHGPRIPGCRDRVAAIHWTQPTMAGPTASPRGPGTLSRDGRGADLGSQRRLRLWFGVAVATGQVKPAKRCREYWHEVAAEEQRPLLLQRCRVRDLALIRRRCCATRPHCPDEIPNSDRRYAGVGKHQPRVGRARANHQWTHPHPVPPASRSGWPICLLLRHSPRLPWPPFASCPSSPSSCAPPLEQLAAVRAHCCSARVVLLFGGCANGVPRRLGAGWQPLRADRRSHRGLVPRRLDLGRKRLRQDGRRRSMPRQTRTGTAPSAWPSIRSRTAPAGRLGTGQRASAKRPLRRPKQPRRTRWPNSSTRQSGRPKKATSRSQ